MKDHIQACQGALLGLAAGDALGTSAEFKRRDSFTPLSDMIGGGHFGLQAGMWTDDTSMALCLGASLLEKKSFDADDQMQRYNRWRVEGYMSSNGRCFDIGSTVSEAISQYLSTGDPFSGPTSPFSAGNGSLMRLAPIAIYYSPNVEQLIDYAIQSSRTTHGAKECLEACAYFATLLHCAFSESDKSKLLSCSLYKASCKKIKLIQSQAYFNKTREQIKGSGYVVDCLEAALWCFAHTDNFADAVLMAANLGDDADTTAAVCGQIAGAFYGMLSIPLAWREKIIQAEMILSMAEQLGSVNLS